MEKSTSPVVVIGALLLGAGKGTTDDLEKKLSDFLAELRKETETITEKVKERV